jgi:hypothetical protein
MTSTTTAAANAETVNETLRDLKADTLACAYSGLTAEDTDNEGEVKIFDDYASGVMPAADAITVLQRLDAIDWCDPENINKESAFTPVWDALTSAGLE